MKVAGIFGVGIAGCQIAAPAEPLRVPFFKIPEIRMNCGNHRTARMKNERYSSGEKRRAVAQRDLGCKLFGEVPVDRGKIHARLFEDVSLFQNTGSSAAAAFARPKILAEARAVNVFYGFDNPILQLFEVTLGSVAPIHIEGHGDYIQLIAYEIRH